MRRKDLAPACGLWFAAAVGGCSAVDSTLAAGSAATTSTATTGAGSPAGAGGAGVGSAATGSGGFPTTGSGGGIPGAWCAPIPTCDVPLPDPGPPIAWTDPASYLIVASGAPNHRGRDLFLNPGDPQWIIAKFSYGLIDKDLKGEDVAIFLLRDCAGSWEALGTARTTQENEHPTEEGVTDSGGRVYFQLPSGKELGFGRHRVHLAVRGDLSRTDLFIEVIPPSTPIVVTDVDGTLTGTETEEFSSLLTGQLPTVHPGAPEAFQTLVSKGAHPMYLTARPEWLVGRTREFLDTYGFPPGIVHTTTDVTGATGAAAATYKTGELAMLAAKGPIPDWAFGNTGTDAEAYNNGNIAPLTHRIFYQFDDTVYGGRRIESYTDLLPELQALPSHCQ